MLDIIKNKEKIKKNSSESYQNVSEEDKNKKREYGRERHKDLPETEKQTVSQYRKQNYEIRKN